MTMLRDFCVLRPSPSSFLLNGSRFCSHFPACHVCAAVDIAGVKMSMNPFCEIAVEEAVRLKEKNIVSEVRCLHTLCLSLMPVPPSSNP